MKRFLVVTVLAVAMPLLAFEQAANKKFSSKAEEEIMKLEDQWVQSRATKDPTVTKDLLSDDFLGATVTGQAMNKQQHIDAVSTGVVTGVVGMDKSRYIRVFVKRNNKWRLVAAQGTRVEGGR